MLLCCHDNSLWRKGWSWLRNVVLFVSIKYFSPSRHILSECLCGALVVLHHRLHQHNQNVTPRACNEDVTLPAFHSRKHNHNAAVDATPRHINSMQAGRCAVAIFALSCASVARNEMYAQRFVADCFGYFAWRLPTMPIQFACARKVQVNSSDSCAAAEWRGCRGASTQAGLASSGHATTPPARRRLLKNMCRQAFVCSRPECKHSGQNMRRKRW